MINYSIIIPHFSRSGTQLLERAVRSVPDRKDLEVLVVDNSLTPISTDLFEIRNNVKVLFSDNTKGAGHARNIGVEASKGKWLLFLDADDFFMNDAFSAFDKYVDTSYEIIFFNTNSLYSDSLENADRHMNYSKIVEDYFKTNDDYNLRTKFSVPWAKMVKSTLVKDNTIKFDEVPASNDVIFSLKTGLTASSVIADLTEVYCITVNRGSLTKTTSLRNLESRFNVSIRKNKILKGMGLRKDSSVMLYIIQSRKYGFHVFSSFLLKAIISRNLFVGYNNWFKTLYILMIFKNKKDREYNVKE